MYERSLWFDWTLVVRGSLFKWLMPAKLDGERGVENPGSNQIMESIETMKKRNMHVMFMFMFMFMFVFVLMLLLMSIASAINVCHQSLFLFDFPILFSPPHRGKSGER
jgi:hypothetical protein